MKLQINNKNKQVALKELNQDLAIAKAMIVNKPELVKYSEAKKIRDYHPIEKKEVVENLINYLLALLGIIPTEEDVRSAHYLVLHEQLITTQSKWTVEQIKKAFSMYISGDLNNQNKRAIHKLDSLILSSVMSLYRVYENNRLKAYKCELNKNLIEIKENKSKLTEEEKEEITRQGLERAFDNYKKNGRISYSRVYLFEYLFNKKLLPLSESEIRNIRDRAIIYQEKKRSLVLSKKEADKIQIFTKAGLDTDDLNTIKRKIAVEDWFDKHEKFNEILTKIKNYEFTRKKT